MKLSIKGPNGKVEVFDAVDNWTFSILRQRVVQRFNLKSDFSIYFGNHQLPTDDLKLFESDMGLVSGDRLRVVLNEKELPARDHASTSCQKTLQEAGGNSSDKVVIKETVFDIVLNEMKREGFELVKREDDNTRWKFSHPNSVLIVEIDFRIYNDRLIKYVHATVSIYHPSGRRFLEPVVLEEKSNDLRKKVSECLVSPLKLAILGHENPLLRLLSRSEVGDRLFELLTARCILRLERTNKYALELCRSERMERIWKILYERDFGKDASTVTAGSYREAYKQSYCQNIRERNFFLRNMIESDFGWGPSFRPSFPSVPYRVDPTRRDPDMPEGPFAPRINPIPFLPGPGSRPDPLRGGEILPSRPSRPGGLPRQYPRGHRFPDRGNMFDGIL